MDLIRLSRRLSAVTGGPGEMVCSRAFRSGPAWSVRLIDAAFWRLRGECGHCRACWEHEHRPRAELPDRLRRAGW